MTRRFVRLLLLSTVMAASGLVHADEAVRKGGELAEAHCARCHAIAAAGASPLAAAPPFRTLSRRYPISDLEEALAEGIATGHPAMPEFAFDPADVTALLAFIQSVQEP